MLLTMVKERMVSPEYIIDIRGIDELKKINLTDKGVEIGPLIIAEDLQSSEIIREKCRPLLLASHYFGDMILQNSVTIGGNICTGLPCTDGLPALMSMDALLEVQSADKNRVMPISNLTLGIGKTTLDSYEMITKIIVPSPDGFKGTYRKLLNSSEACIANTGITYNPIRKKLRLVIGGLDKVPYYFDESSIGWRWDGTLRENMERVNEVIDKKVTPMSNAVASPEYRKSIAKILVARNFKELFGRV